MHRRGPCLTPFAPQRIVAVTRARAEAFISDRARPRGGRVRARGRLPSWRREGRDSLLGCRAERAERIRKKPWQRCGVVGVGINNQRAAELGELGGARARGAGRRRRGVAASARRGVGPAILPRPVRPAENLRRAPPPLGALPRLRRRAGWGGTQRCSQDWDAAALAGKNALVISPECWLCLSSFSGGGLVLGDASLPVLLGAGAKKIK